MRTTHLHLLHEDLIDEGSQHRPHWDALFLCRYPRKNISIFLDLLNT